MTLQRPVNAVTFDCWNTLLYELEPQAGHAARVGLFTGRLHDLGIQISQEEATDALNLAWKRHWEDWEAGVVTTAEDMACWALERFGIREPATVTGLATELEEVALEQRILPLPGAGNTLEELAGRGIRRALICDTGFSPGRVVRQLLDRAGLLDFLEVQIFSDEMGVPKPNERVFRAALDPLGVPTRNAVHVGDLLRTDVAGARAVGMGSVRIRFQHDDPSAFPEADAVADSHAHLLEILT